MITENVFSLFHINKMDLVNPTLTILILYIIRTGYFINFYLRGFRFSIFTFGKILWVCGNQWLVLESRTNAVLFPDQLGSHC